MPPSKKSPQESHSNSRSKVCAICLGKASPKLSLTSNLISALKQFTSLFENIPPQDERVPSGLCEKCRYTLRLKMQGKGNDKTFNIPLDFNYTSVIISKPTCNCKICTIAAALKGRFSKNNQPKSSKVSKKTTCPTLKRLCYDCLSVIGKGLEHTGSDTTTLENLKELHKRKPIVAEAFAAYIIKSKDASPNGTRRLSVLHGPKLPVTIGPSDSPKEAISHEDMINFQKKVNLSQRQTLELKTFLNQHEAKVEKGLQEELYRHNHILDPQYQIVRRNLLIGGEFVEKPIIAVKDASEFILHIYDLRNQSPENYIVRIQLDDGREYLKLSTNLVPKFGWERENQKKGENLAGVKKCFILAIAYRTPENHHNLSIFCEVVNIWGIKDWYIFDYKTKNLFYGLMSNSSTFRCNSCLAHKDNLGQCGKIRTVSMVAHDYERFISLGKGNRKLGKLFNCVVDQPLFFETLEEMKACHDPVSDFSPPEELHLMLGIVNHIKKEMGEIDPTLMEQWVIDSNVSAAGYWEGTYEGNPCRALLENIGFLEDNYGNAKNPILTAHINTLKSFNSVRHACFGQEIHPDYEEKIEKFRTDYMVLVEDYGASILVKGHEVFFHVAPWLKKWNIPLGAVSAQAEEDLHSVWRNYVTKKNVGSAENLRLAVVAFGSYNI